MHPHPLPLAQEVVLVGGGHAHALLLKRWGMDPLPGARLTVITPEPTAPYTGMLPGFIAGHYARDDLEIDIVRLARFAGARLIFGLASGLDLSAKTVDVVGRPPVRYDLLSLDIGITSDMPDLPGFGDHAIAAKPLGPYADRWTRHLDEGGPVAVIGGGVAGVELALAMHHALSGRGAVTVIEADRALRDVSDPARERLLSELAAARIDLIENVRVERIEAESVTLSDGRTVAAALTVGAAGARPHDWLSTTGLDLTKGYVTVDATLRSVTDPAVFAVGDCAHLSQSPRPKAGVYAVRAAPVLTRNIRAALTGEALEPFRPQKHYLKLVSLGRKAAVADKWNRAISGDWAWTLKDRIDRAFMEKLGDLTPMAPPPLPEEVANGVAEALGPKPLCGGCGAKVGPGALDRALAALPDLARDDIETGAGDDAAVLRIGGVRQVLTTDHLRAVWEDPYVMARIVALHALGDVWAMGASPQAALAQITLPRMAERMQEGWLAEIMSAAGEVFAQAGAAIAGGHTTLGPELSIGFTVTGLLDRSALTISGAREGDALILSRPIGSGTILAAEMELKAHGRDVKAALDILCRTQGDAASRLATVAHAMTDVTGFGLAGHLSRMARASGLSAEIDLAAVPFLPGATALAEAGVRSSIWAANRAAVEATVPSTARGALLFDPQTAGGFLAAVPEAAAESAVADLRAMGHDAARIGRMTAKGHVTLAGR
ncbi:selenide, water dikinase SelD [Silicimonas algicola]|uniref:Selenophosphate synthase n=1 Tax=Silicimonas algicola TaxID=1826607 RepID=A0A316GA52_9RHOB|nr:selenide, water dikinase SelD [Silicimonas algicola]AZQ67798.1 selenide, water dikinase SelD [Silicimonas algicola]PWK57784.1 selenophosphate synthase [Silicimonas algicola]